MAWCKSFMEWWKIIRVRKYYVIESKWLFWINIILCFLALGGLGALAYFFNFIYREINYVGVPVITLTSTDAYFKKNGATIAAKIEDFAYPVPFENKFTIAKRTKTTYQSLKYCNDSNCSAGCLNFWKSP